MVVNKSAVQETGINEFGDGIAWFRGSMIGKGGFGCVYLATLKNPKYNYLPPVMAVKSAEVSVSGSIQKEREVLTNVQGCPNIIRCFGEETTISENGLMIYNLLLEYGSGGTLADRINKSGGNGLPEFEVKVYTRSILLGLNHIHGIGYVHCDLKPENILLVPDNRIGGISEFRAKIADFGLAKRDNKQSKKRKWELYWRGTPMYLSPEAVMDSVQDFPSDIWAIGCIVLEMLTGKSPWDSEPELNAENILEKIGIVQELPKIPNGISKEAKEFLKGCFVRKPVYRLTAEMLLNHPFLEGVTNDADIEELEVEDLNESDLILLVPDSDDEFNHGLFPNEYGFASEEDCFSYWSYEEEEEEEEEESVEDQSVCNFMEVEEIKGVVNSAMVNVESNLLIESSRQSSSQVSSKNRQQYPVSFTISAGI